MMARFFVAAAAGLALMLGAAAAQEPPAPKPEAGATGVEVKTLLENEQMHVMEVRFKPGAKTSTISHPNRFLYGLTDGSLVFSPAGKTPYELTFKRGEALWLPADAMATQNDTDKEVRALVVEVKGMTHAASAKPSGKGKHGGRRRGRGRKK